MFPIFNTCLKVVIHYFIILYNTNDHGVIDVYIQYIAVY